MPKPVHHPPALTLAPDCMNANVKQNLLAMMESPEGRAAVVLLIVTLLEAYEQDQPEAPTTTPCQCEICQENLADSSKMLNEVRASVGS